MSTGSDPEPLHRLAFELAASPDATGREVALRAVRGMVGVAGAQLDDGDQGACWGGVTYDPSAVGIPRIVGCLAAHGYRPIRTRLLGISAARDG